MKKRHRLQRKILEVLDLPQETEGTLPKLTMIGQGDLLVENHSGVLQYAKDAVRLRTKIGTLLIAGEELNLLELAAERAYVRGCIQSIAFEDDGTKRLTEK